MNPEIKTNEITNESIIIGAGMTGMAIGRKTGAPIFEAQSYPGGICASYYKKSHVDKRRYIKSNDEETYIFEYGGGHWMFGDPSSLGLIELEPPVALTQYSRRASVYFANENLKVPYPIQHNLHGLGNERAHKAYEDIRFGERTKPKTMKEWLNKRFGSTLMDLFFEPFHNLYTAGYHEMIAPQDNQKSLIDMQAVRRGLRERQDATGYNATFLYPDLSLGYLANRMARKCVIHYGKKLVWVDTNKRKAIFSDGSIVGYKNIFTTIPLNKMCRITGMSQYEESLPYTSVLVINISGKKGSNFPDEYWLYIPRSKSGFHRIGFYSNVSRSFLPRSMRDDENNVSMYIEKSFKGGKHIFESERKLLREKIIDEIVEWGFLERPEIVDDTWIDVAYTWSLSYKDTSSKPSEAIEELERLDIFPVGRYARWKFQGILESIREGYWRY